MSSCPVCNGFQTYTRSCPICQELLTDVGRESDLFGDYSPYQSIELCKRTDGWVDIDPALCPHRVSCENCGFTDMEIFAEQ